MNTKTNCCGGTVSPCDSTIAELPRYYPRQLITPDDLTLEQNYFRDRMRRHNRLLHGWGVVCGALVCPATVTNSDNTTSFTPWQIQVQQGYVLGPYGDEIILDCVRTVDLRTSGCSGVTGQPCIDAPDPWCSQVFTPPSTTNLLYIAVKYKQCMMRPVRVQSIGCGCDDTSCEYSRWHDGYEIGVLTTCPSCNACDQSVLPPPSPQSLASGPVPVCPDCSCGPWVCLAQVTLSSDGSGTIQQIDNCACRRMVLSLCNFWWQPTCAGTTTTVVNVTDAKGNIPGQVTADGKTSFTLTVNGTNLETGPGVSYSFGPGIEVNVTGPNTSSSVTLSVTAETTVPPEIYNLTVVNADCSVVIFANAIQVAAASGSTTSAGVSRGSGAKSIAQKTAVAGSQAGAQPTPSPAKAASKAKPAASKTANT